jgi:hypothetical protein
MTAPRRPGLGIYRTHREPSSPPTGAGGVGDIQPDDRLVFEATGRVFNITSVNLAELLDADMTLEVSELKTS